MNISSASSPAAPVPSDSNRIALPQDQSALIRAVQSLNDSEMFGQENELTFAIDRVAHVVVVRLVNKDTRELVEQSRGRSPQCRPAEAGAHAVSRRH
jgi:hypothetical protein